MALSGSDDRATVADLEVFGLSLMMINLLEERFGILYVDELARIDREDVLAIPWCGPKHLAELVRALRRFLSGEKAVMTVEDCVRM